MKKKLVAIISTVAMLVTMIPAVAFAQDAGNGSQTNSSIARIGDTYYDTLQDAVDAVPNNIETEIVLIKGCGGNGVKVPSDKKITFNLSDHTYTVDGELVGSTGTETNGFQLLKKSKVTFKNGTIESDEAKILIQNYADLTLENVILKSESADYVLSNNYGNTNLTGNTSIYAGEGKVAFDAYYWPKNGYEIPPVITIDTTGVIDGKIEITEDGSRSEDNANESSLVKINKGTITQPITVNDEIGQLEVTGGRINEIIDEKGSNKIKVSGGEFETPIKASYCDENKVPVVDETGVCKLVNEGTVSEEMIKDDNGCYYKNNTAIAKHNEAIITSGATTTAYTTLEEAVNVAKAGDTITLMKDVAVEDTLEINANEVTFNGNGKTVTLKTDRDFDINGKPPITAIINATGDKVTVQNVNLTGTDGKVKHGVQFYKSEGSVMSGVTVNGTAWTGVLVNGSQVTIKDSVLNPASGAYAAIEYCMGSEVNEEIPTIKLENVNINSGKYNVWADNATLNKMQEALGGSTEAAAIDKIVESVTTENNASVVVTIGMRADNNETNSTTKPSTKPSNPGGGTSTPSVTKDRVSGANRFETAFKVADELKGELGIVKFNNIVVAYSDEYADALSATALAADKDAPILVVNKNNESKVKSYIDKNLNKGGNVYIIGGTAAVSEKFEDSLAGYKVTRLGGADRYATNIAVLKALGVSGASDIMVASGLKYPDALSASATGEPVLLVGKTLTADQLAYIKTLGGNDDYYVIGGTSAVNTTVMNQLKAANVGDVTRLGGTDRYETGLAVAEEFFGRAKTVVLASGNDFPDGLTGGVLANAMNAPLMLVNQYNTSEAADFVDDNNVKTVVAIGGTTAISNATLNKVA